MNSKQLFLTTALITSLSSAAIADVSISGETKVNIMSGGYALNSDLYITGESGDTSIVTEIGLDWPSGETIKQLFMKSSIAGINVKTGTFKTNKDELKHTVTKSNATQLSVPFGTKPINSYTDDIDSLSCHNGNSCFELVWQDISGPGGEYAMIKGSLVGVKFLHKDNGWKKESKVISTTNGVNVTLHNKDYLDGSNDKSFKVSALVNGMNLTYANIKSDNGTSTNGFLGKHVVGSIQEANGFGISTTIAGNKVTYKNIEFDGEDSQKLILTRKIESGATFEATYHGDALDLELAVKF